jgi:hypothetical protein
MGCNNALLARYPQLRISKATSCEMRYSVADQSCKCGAPSVVDADDQRHSWHEPECGFVEMARDSLAAGGSTGRA